MASPMFSCFLLSPQGQTTKRANALASDRVQAFAGSRRCIECANTVTTHHIINTSFRRLTRDGKATHPSRSVSALLGRRIRFSGRQIAFWRMPRAHLVTGKERMPWADPRFPLQNTKSYLLVDCKTTFPCIRRDPQPRH